MRTQKRILFIGFLLCLLAVFPTGCGDKEKSFTELSQLNDSSISIAMWSGGPMERAKAQFFPKAQAVVAVDSIAMNIANLRGKKVDAFLTSRVFYDTYPDKQGLKLLDGELGSTDYAFFFAQTAKGRALRDQMNEFIAKADESGLRAELEALWLSDAAVEKAEYTGSEDPNAPELVFAAEYQTPPFGYMDGDACTGFDVAYADCFCKEYGYRMKVVGLPFSMISAGDVSGEYDFAGGALMVDESLAASKTVSDIHYRSPFVIVVRDEEAGGSPFSLKDSLRKTFIEDARWKMYLGGLLTTLLIFSVSAVLGSLLGFILYLAGLEAGKGFHRVVGAVFTVLHITPTVVLLMIFYHIIFHGVNISGLIISIIVFVLLTAGSVYNLMLSAVATVDRGQTEAAVALGCRPSQAFFRVVMPQAMRHFLPLYKGELVGLVKVTSIVGYIAVQDLTKVSDIIQTRTFDAFVPLFCSAVLYILLAFLLIRLVDIVFKRTDPKSRSREKILAGIPKEKEAAL